MSIKSWTKDTKNTKEKEGEEDAISIPSVFPS